MAADEVVEALRQTDRRLDGLHRLVEILRGRQLHAPLLDDLLAEQGGFLVAVEPLRVAALALHGRFPVLGHDAEMNLVDVAILDGHVRTRVVPHALHSDLAALGLNLVDEIVAHRAAGALRERIPTLAGDAVCLHLVAFLIEVAGEVETGAGGNAMIRPALDEALEGAAVTSVLLFAERLVLAEVDAREVGIDERALVLVILVEAQQILEQLQRLHRAAFVVRGLDFPCHEFLGRIKHRILCAQLKRIGRLCARLFATAVKLQRIVHEEIIHRRAIRIRLRTLVQQLVILRHRRLLQNRLARQCLRELLVDLGENARQIPRLKILAWRGARACALQEAPAVLLEIMPAPIGENRVHHRYHLLGRLGDLRLQSANLLLRFVALDIALQGDFFADRLDGLSVLFLG